MRHGAACPFLLCFLFGCSAFRAAPISPVLDESGMLASLNEGFAPGVIRACIATPVAVQDACRNEVAQSLLIAIDLTYAEWEVGFFNDTRLGGFAATFATLGLGAAGAVSPTGTAQALAAAVTGIAGAREAFNEGALENQTSIALLTTMRAQRNIVALRIRIGLAQPATKYPLGFALSDLYAYFRAGTMVGAVSGLVQTSGSQADQAQSALATPVNNDDAARALLHRLGATDAEQAAKDKTAIRSKMDKLGIPASVTPSDFATDPRYDFQVQVVAHDLGYLP